MRTGLSVEEAQEVVLAAAAPVGSEMVPAARALGRVLTEAVSSRRTLPPADVSAMDGYAVRTADLVAAGPDRPMALEVTFEVAAGAPSERTVTPGTAARIFTGAALPAGADAVVRQEDTEPDSGGRVLVRVAPGRRDHVRDAGEDVREGDEILAAGTCLGPAHLGMLAAVGRSVVRAHRRPSVAIASGGDELVEPDGDPSGGRIVSSNSYTLAAQCREVGARPVYLGIARDTPEDLERLLRSGLDCDVLVSSAGVSVGDRDYVRGVLEKLGCRLEFWGVKMKPGYPLAFGRFAPSGDGRPGGPLVFALPGNPVSAMVTFEQFVRPVLRRMAGHASCHRRLVRARLAETLEKAAGRLHFVRVRLEPDGDGWLARTTGNQSSGVLRSMTLADGLLVFPAEATRLEEGAVAHVQLLDPDLALFRKGTELGPGPDGAGTP